MDKYHLYVVLTRTKTIVSRLIHFVSRDEYTHAAISYNRDLSVMYSFARKNTYNPFVGRFRSEELDKGVYGLQKKLPGIVIELEVTKEQYDKAVELLNEFIRHSENYKYNYIGIINSWLGRSINYEYRFVCSEFVYHILYESGIADFKISRNLVKPQDLLDIDGKIIFRGDLKQYKNSRVNCVDP
ncbi:MAG: hypothetical protein PHC96_09035 [Firmicutes bacterium]|nr:hypothetical protein [Bacillota bacterium]